MLFLSLNCFSATGGIEKVCRVVSKAIYDISRLSNASMQSNSLHDQPSASIGNRYFPSEYFRGFGGRMISFLRHSIWKGIGSDVVLLSHINLLPVGWMIKKLSPKTQIYLFAHGIEIWEIPLGFRRHLLGACDRFLCVSSHTLEKLTSMHGVPAFKCEVLNNCLDPFLPNGRCLEHWPDLRASLNIHEDAIVIFTLARMQASERYKGYDKILKILPSLKERFPGIKYVMGGKADMGETTYLEGMIAGLGLTEDVKMVGYIPEEQVPAYFKMADLFVMPSHNEGFGISFIESLHFGIPVLSGNKDGSRDVMISPGFGMMADPFNLEEIAEVLESLIKHRDRFLPDGEMVRRNFGYDHYVNKLKTLLAA